MTAWDGSEQIGDYLERQTQTDGYHIVYPDVDLDPQSALVWGMAPDGTLHSLWYARRGQPMSGSIDAVSPRHAPHEQLGPLPAPLQRRVETLLSGLRQCGRPYLSRAGRWSPCTRDVKVFGAACWQHDPAQEVYPSRWLCRATVPGGWCRNIGQLPGRDSRCAVHVGAAVPAALARVPCSAATRSGYRCSNTATVGGRCRQHGDKGKFGDFE